MVSDYTDILILKAQTLWNLGTSYASVGESWYYLIPTLKDISGFFVAQVYKVLTLVL